MEKKLFPVVDKFYLHSVPKQNRMNGFPDVFKDFSLFEGGPANMPLIWQRLENVNTYDF